MTHPTEEEELLVDLDLALVNQLTFLTIFVRAPPNLIIFLTACIGIERNEII